MKRRLTQHAVLAGLALAPLASMPATGANAQTVVRPASEIVLSIGLLQILLPAVVTYGIYRLCHRAGWIKDGDMALNL